MRSGTAPVRRPSLALVLVLGAFVVVVIGFGFGRRLFGLRLEGAHPQLLEIVVRARGARPSEPVLRVVVQRCCVDLTRREERILGVGAELLASPSLGQGERR